MSLGTHSSTKKEKLLVVAICAATLLAAYLYFLNLNQKYSSITSFRECVDAGFPILETYPEQCKMPGKFFVNKDQIRAVEATSTEDKRSDILDHTYLINGTEVGIVATTDEVATSGLQYVGLLLEDTLNGDSLKDSVFVAKTLGRSSEYFLLLALGLYSGETTAANGIALGTTTPQYLVRNKDGTLRVAFTCTHNVPCFKDFHIINDILEPHK